MDGAGAAEGHATAELGACQFQRVPDEPEQFHLRVNVHGSFLAVYHEIDPAQLTSSQVSGSMPRPIIDGSILKSPGCRSKYPMRLANPAYPLPLIFKEDVDACLF